MAIDRMFGISNGKGPNDIDDDSIFWMSEEDIPLEDILRGRRWRARIERRRLRHEMRLSREIPSTNDYAFRSSSICSIIFML